MPKYAMIWCTDRGYMPGTNACLNAMEMYEFPDNIDIFVRFWWDIEKQLPVEYRKQWPRVSFGNIDTSIREKANAGWYLRFDHYHYALKELSNYDVVLFWGGDMCILNNFSFYFDMAYKLDQIILGTNEHTACYHYNAMTPKDEHPYKHTWEVPYADVPLFVPKSKLHVLQYNLDLQSIPGARVSNMDGLNYALRDLGEKVYPLPGFMWIHNVPNWMPLKCDRKHVYCFNERMHSFHRKYWNAGYLKQYIRGKGPIAAHNVRIFNNMYNFFNKNCRVKWEEGIDVWDGSTFEEDK